MFYLGCYVMHMQSAHDAAIVEHTLLCIVQCLSSYAIYASAKMQLVEQTLLCIVFYCVLAAIHAYA